MTRLSIAWFTLAAMCILLVFKVNLHSDLLFLDSVAVDIFHHGGTWSNWKITPAPAYFPDMLLYALAYFVLPNPTQRVVLVCLFQALLLAWTCLYLARAIKPSLSRNATVVVLLVLAAVVLVAANSSMWLFFNSTNNHFAALVFPLLCLAWILAFLKQRRPVALLLIACGVAAGTASTSIFTLAFTLPALIFLAGCLLVLRAHRPLRRSAALIAAAILAGQAGAALLQKALLTYNAMDGRPMLTLEAALHSISAFAAATVVTFGPGNPYTQVMAFSLLICIVWVLIDWVLHIRVSIVESASQSAVVQLDALGKNWAYGLSAAFLLVMLPVNVIGAVLSGGFGDDWGYRYFTFPIALGALLTVLMLDFKSVFDSPRAVLASRLALVALASLGILCIKPLLLQTDRPSFAALAKLGARGPADAVGACIDLEAKNGFVFGAGIGDFWNARVLPYKTANALYVLPVINDAMPFFHMVTLGPLLDPQKYGIKSYNFAVLRKSGTTTAFNLTPETLGRILPRPTRTVNCENSDSELWLYTDATLDTAVRKRVYQFLGREGAVRDYRATGNDLPGTIGKVQSLSRMAEAGTDAQGYLSYGPYMTVPAGRYRVVISYTATASGNKWDAGRFNDPANLIKLGAGDVPPGNGELAFSFETGKKVPNFEIRTWFGGRGTFSIHQIHLQAVPSP